MLQGAKPSSEEANLFKGQISGLENAHVIFLPLNDSKYALSARVGISYIDKVFPG